MDLIHDLELSHLKSQYAGAMVAVAVVTYAAAIRLVLFVDRRKVMPVLTEQLANLESVVSDFRKGRSTKDSKAARERGDEEGTKSTGWLSLGKLNLRRRQGVDKRKGVVEEVEESTKV